MKNSKGFPTNALFGFTNMINKIDKTDSLLPLDIRLLQNFDGNLKKILSMSLYFGK